MTLTSVSVLFLGLMIAIPDTLSSSAVTCDTDFTDLAYSISPVFCPENCWRQYPRNQLCGLEKYSGGSICLAAMQLGLVDDVSGGFVKVYKNIEVSFKPVGGLRYAVTSHNCSRSAVSYTFDITCNTKGNAMYALNEAWCPPGCGGDLVLGSDPYHVNSSVCSAAVHAGKVTKEHGGEVTLYKLNDVRSNLNGSVRNGVKSVGSSRSSVNIFTFGFFNECKLSTPVCQNNATCHDIKYGFGCSCTPGFQGRICDTDINECGLAGSCGTNAVCYNTKGSFICTCNAGYSGDGKNCVDINECGLTGSCDTNAVCINTKGSFTCTCNVGYSGDGKICTVQIFTACYAGVKDGRVKDAQMTASTSSDRTPNPPNKARLDGPGSWMTNYNQVGDWLQVDFLANKKIYGVVTQGYRIMGWVTKFKIQHSTDGKNFQPIKEGSTAKIFEGNVDGDSHKINRFSTPITAQYFRLVVVAINTSGAWPYLRLEYLTC